MPVGRFPRPAQLGLRRRAALRAGCRLRPPGRPEGAGRRRARARADGAPRRRLQPLRAGGQLPARYAPQFFTDRHQTPWGAAINYRRPGTPSRCASSSSTTRSTGSRSSTSTACASTRCTRSWTTAPKHLLDELAERVRARLPRPPRPPGARERRQRGAPSAASRRRPRRYTAQWNDDVHHVLHAAATGERTATTPTTPGDTDQLGRALAEGFALPGRVMPYRGSAARRAERRPAARRLRRLPPEPRPDRQPRVRRAPDHHRRARGGARLAAALPAAAADAAALHGRGMGRHAAVPVLLRFRRRTGRRRAQGPARGVRPLSGVPGPRAARPHSRSDVPRATFTSAKLDWTAVEHSQHRRWLDVPRSDRRASPV